jgi:hypothetical protein
MLTHLPLTLHQILPSTDLTSTDLSDADISGPDIPFIDLPSASFHPLTFHPLTLNPLTFQTLTFTFLLLSSHYMTFRRLKFWHQDNVLTFKSRPFCPSTSQFADIRSIDIPFTDIPSPDILSSSFYPLRVNPLTVYLFDNLSQEIPSTYIPPGKHFISWHPVPDIFSFLR